MESHADQMKKETEDHLEHLFHRYYTAHREGRLSDAENGYLDLLKQKPDWGRVLNALGNLFLDRNQPEKARPLFEKATRLTPPDLSACYNLGRMKQLENDHRGAIDNYTIMLDHHPESGLVWNNLGVAYRETGKRDESMASFHKAVRFAPEMAQAWNNLGVAQDEANQAENAITSYQKAIELEPDYASPHLNLGILLQKSGHFEKAEEHYTRVLKILPGNDVATFMLQSLGKGETPEAPPVEHVRNIFDQCADNFETLLVDGLDYKTPEYLFNLVRPYLTEKMAILDIGCGTGLGALSYKPFAESLTGVDISEKMLEKASEKNVYNRLEMFDILQPWTFPSKFDLIYSSDVFVYLGNLNPVLKSISACLADGGILAFSVEKLDDTPEDYRLYPSGRYAHSQNYIRTCLDLHGFTAVEISETVIRQQSGQPVNGLLVVAKNR
jgi:predicted TPR repeat methyltransferase